MATLKQTIMPARSTLPSRSSGRLGSFIQALLALLIVVGLSVGATWYVMTQFYLPKQAAAGTESSAPAATAAAPAATPAPVAAPAPAPVIAAPIFVPLEPFTVTLANDQMERILHTAITLRVADLPSEDRIKSYMPEVRSRILFILSQQPPDTVQQANTRVALAMAISKAISMPFSPMTEPQHITDVLFTDFVVQ